GATRQETRIIADDLIRTNSNDAWLLSKSADSPSEVATHSNTASALARINQPKWPGPPIQIANLPTCVVDDLIDRGVHEFDFSNTDAQSHVTGRRDLPL